MPTDDLEQGLLCMGVGLETICLEDLVAHADKSSVQTNGHWLQTPLDRTAVILGNRYGLAAGRITNCSACAAGTQVVGEAWQMLRHGEAAVALAGAADSMLNPLGLGGFSLLRVLSAENDCPQQACRPFDVTREGTVLGEGAGFLVMEVLEHAAGPGRHDLC